MLARRIAAVSLLAPVLLAGSANAAQRTVWEILNEALTGCYGVAVVVCDPHVSGSPVDVDKEPVDVCAGSCQTVGVPVPGPSDERWCVGWSDQSGNTTERCILRPQPTDSPKEPS